MASPIPPDNTHPSAAECPACDGDGVMRDDDDLPGDLVPRPCGLCRPAPAPKEPLAWGGEDDGW